MFTPVVDARGLVTPWPGGWSLDWWIGADDRWHVPAKEVAVRQRLLDDMPVVETLMRVPSGDAVHRAYAVRAGDDELVVVEVENRSPIPFALALAIRPPARRIDLQGDNTVRVDGRVAMVLSKPAARVATSRRHDGDVVDVVTSGDAGESFEPVRRRDRGAMAAFVWPVAHRTSLRVALPLARHRRLKRAISPGSLPSAEQVANGWKVQGDRGMRLVLPDPQLQSEVDAARRFLLLGGDALTLALYGYEHEAVDAERFGPDTPDPGDDFLLQVRNRLVRETADGLALCPDWPNDWFGLPLEVHDAPTQVGPCSFAVRWHGDRAALLWEIEPFDPDRPIVLTAPGLDQAWSSSEWQGEALLSPVVPATPVTLGITRPSRS